MTTFKARPWAKLVKWLSTSLQVVASKNIKGPCDFCYVASYSCVILWLDKKHDTKVCQNKYRNFQALSLALIDVTWSAGFIFRCLALMLICQCSDSRHKKTPTNINKPRHVTHHEISDRKSRWLGFSKSLYESWGSHKTVLCQCLYDLGNYLTYSSYHEIVSWKIKMPGLGFRYLTFRLLTALCNAAFLHHHVWCNGHV